MLNKFPYYVRHKYISERQMDNKYSINLLLLDVPEEQAWNVVWRQPFNPLAWKTVVLVEVQKMAVMHQKIFVLLQLKQ